MSHTNTTANYNLPQFVGTDKPSWLTDVNGAMTSIDTQMKANADANTTTAGDLTTLAGRVTTAEQNITTQGSTLQTVSNVASTASTTATNAKNKADGIESYLTLTQFNTLVTSVSNVSLNWSNVREAVNADGSFGKIYGTFVATPTSTSNAYITFASSFRPTSQITINGAGFKQRNTGGADKTLYAVDMIISPDGTVRIDFASSEYNAEFRVMLPPCVYFAKDFGDTGQ